MPEQPPIAVVTISPGRFHHLDLARQLIRHQALRRFYTGYPARQLRRHGFFDPLTVTFPWFVTPYMAYGRLGTLPRKIKRAFERLIPWSLDWFAALTMPPCDALIALSQSGLRAGTKVRARGGIYICDRGSSHIRYQDEILREEFQRWGEVFRGVDPWVIAREEAEYAAADLITLPSSFAMQSFAAFGVAPEKLRHVPYGVDLGKFRKIADPAKDCLDVLFVGQLSFRKGVPDLLQAFEQLRHPAKRLRLVGAMQPEMARYLARHSLPDNVAYLGALAQPDVARLMNGSHVMVLPSIEDGLGLVIAEAMACGCPVIASVNTGASDLLEDGKEGFVVPIRSPGHLADRMQRFADEAELRMRMGEAARARVRRLGGWESYGDEMMRVMGQARQKKASVSFL